MWDKILGNWVEKHLGTYFKNLDVHKFRLDLGKGDLKLGPLELRPEVLDPRRTCFACDARAAACTCNTRNTRCEAHCRSVHGLCTACLAVRARRSCTARTRSRSGPATWAR